MDLAPQLFLPNPLLEHKAWSETSRRDNKTTAQPEQSRPRTHALAVSGTHKQPARARCDETLQLSRLATSKRTRSVTQAVSNDEVRQPCTEQLRAATGSYNSSWFKKGNLSN
ncbi:hypothetical protein HI914_05369 [Erysiphe necator]|nr:hypothetical protein HI914_05369 [Erysiphe necator]